MDSVGIVIVQTDEVLQRLVAVEPAAVLAHLNQPRPHRAGGCVNPHGFCRLDNRAIDVQCGRRFLGHAEAGGKVGSIAGPGGGGDDCVDVVDRQCRFDQALADRLAALIAASDPSTPTTTGADDFHMIRLLIPWAMHSPCPGRYWNP